MLPYQQNFECPIDEKYTLLLPPKKLNTLNLSILSVPSYKYKLQYSQDHNIYEST